MHDTHELWEATPEEAAWNVAHGRAELVALPYAHLGQRIITEVLDAPERKNRLLF